MEIIISDLAKEKIIAAFRENKEENYIRIYVTKAGCSGAQYGLAFDEKKDGDEITEIDNINFISDTEYMPVYSNGINIEYVNEPKEGFIITSLKPIESKCSGSCAGCNH